MLAYGWRADGQLGNGTREDQLVPAQVSGLAEVVEGACHVMVAAGLITPLLTRRRARRTEDY